MWEEEDERRRKEDARDEKDDVRIRGGCSPCIWVLDDLHKSPSTMKKQSLFM